MSVRLTESEKEVTIWLLESLAVMVIRKGKPAILAPPDVKSLKVKLSSWA